MENLLIKSYFGGSEYIRVNYPDVFSIIISHQKNHIFNIESFFNQILENNPEMVDIGTLFESPDSLFQSLTFPDIKNVAVYLLNSLAFYFPKENQNFWFDILSLDYLFSKGIFNACVLCISRRLLFDRKIEISHFLALLKDSSFGILKFPLLITFEFDKKEINK